jgi:hypothetical protein
VPHIKFYSTNGLNTPQVGSDLNMDLSWVALKAVFDTIVPAIYDHTFRTLRVRTDQR